MLYMVMEIKCVFIYVYVCWIFFLDIFLEFEILFLMFVNDWFEIFKDNKYCDVMCFF